MDEEFIISFNNYGFTYQALKNPTLKGIDLKIRKGEKILIVGHSGSGKSTMGNCINGLIPNCYSGDISGGLVVHGVSPEKEDLRKVSAAVGTVLQDSDGQFVGLTVGEDIAFSLENSCVPRKEMIGIVRKTARMVDMESYLEQAPHELSGGQKQRVSMAGVIIDDVPILLYDEPLANLDPKTGEVAIELIDQIHRETGKTTVIIEHRIEDVLHRPVDRIVLMENGEIIAIDTPANLLAGEYLIQKGLREPLYLTAMKYAGCEVQARDNPESIGAIRMESHKNTILKWFKDSEEYRHSCDGDPILELKNICFSYDGERKILNDISYEIRKGEMVSILGKNGAGKSTMSKLIMGLIKADSGSVFYDGQDISKDSITERARKIGFVMQNPNHMISHDMIFDEIAFGLKLRGVDAKEIRTKVEEILELCDLKQFMTWPISTLSYGQKKRVTIASILVLGAELLILDEPTAGQDYYHYTKIMSFLEKLNRDKGITILFVTHDMHLALEHTDRSMVILDGEKIADAPLAQVFSDRDVISRANLKQTSLFALAERIGVEETDSFINCFIAQERRIRSGQQ